MASKKVKVGGNLGFVARIINKIKNSDQDEGRAAETLSYKKLHK